LEVSYDEQNDYVLWANCKFNSVASSDSRVCFNLGVSNTCKDADARKQEKCRISFDVFLLMKYEIEISAAIDPSLFLAESNFIHYVIYEK
jgi:hypothetical protein